MIYSLDEDHGWRFKKPLIVLAVLIFFGALGTGGYFVYKEFFRAKKQPDSQPMAQTNPIPDPISAVQGRYLFNGTTVWARAVEKHANGNFAQPFSRLSTFEREKYDAWSTDLECPITDNVVPYETQVSKLIFNCRPQFLSEASKFFNLYDLANNHTDNQNGQAGIATTRAYLEAAGVQYFGNYDPTLTQEICEVVGLPVRLIKADKTEEKASLPVAFCAWHFFNYFRGPKPEELAVVKQYADLMPVFGFVEMGAEYNATATTEQTNIAHQLIDTGLDFLLANNPHWVQNTEVYKGKLIVYSLGNFIFDQLDAETQRGASIDTTMTVAYDGNVAKWIALGQSCKKFQDDCLTTAQQKNFRRVDMKLTYAVIASQGGAGKLTRRAETTVQAAVEARMNWLETAKALNQ